MLSRPQRSYGRISSRRRLSERQQKLFAELLPKLEIDHSNILDPKALFSPPVEAVWCEIGFGGGEHLLEQARRHKKIGFIGAEPFVSGQASVLAAIKDEQLSNIRLYRHDIRILLPQLGNAGLQRIYCLFPDIWPKKRHHKRRLIQPGLVAELARTLQIGGEMRLATDWKDYAHQIASCFLQDEHFVWTAQQANDWRSPPPDHITTRYQSKRLGDCQPVFLNFVRSGRS